MDTLNVRLNETRSPGRIYRWIDFAGQTVWWEFQGPEDVLPPPLARHDMVATCLVFYAMKRGISLHIEGPVSRTLLENMEELIACWTVWRPNLYRRTKITASEEIVADQPGAHARGRGIAAFSGGVDASFTLLRHIRRDVGRRSREIVAGVLIHGLDIQLDQGAAFDTASATAAATLGTVGVPLVTVKTNWRDVVQGDWEMEFGSAVSTCLQAWQGSVATALVGSDADYARLVIPWGGNPITYAMLSSPDFTVVYDGADSARTEKVEYLSSWAEGIANLRVCWAGPQTGRNCGYCEKCLRTKLNFMAVGKPLPAGLAGIPTLLQVFRIRARKATQLALLHEIVQIAEQRKIPAAWVKVLRVSIRKNEYINRSPLIVLPTKALRRLKSAIRIVLTPLLDKRLQQESR